VLAFGGLITQFENATELELREQVAKALLSKGMTLGELKRRDEAIAAYDQLLARLGGATEPALREIAEDARRHRSEL
jgi:hypothetical protein